MRVVLQRVTRASVSIEGNEHASIGQGILILLGIEDADTTEDIEWLTAKISKLRIFNDADGVMNLSVNDIDGEVMVISQFTLHANIKKGNRPSYIRAAKPDIAISLYEKFVDSISTQTGKPAKTGVFGAMMDISMVNSGPVTIISDTKNKE